MRAWESCTWWILLMSILGAVEGFDGKESLVLWLAMFAEIAEKEDGYQKFYEQLGYCR